MYVEMFDVLFIAAYIYIVMSENIRNKFLYTFISCILHMKDLTLEIKTKNSNDDNIIEIYIF